MLGVSGRVFCCFPKQHLGIEVVMELVGLGAGKRFQTSDMVHLGCLGDGELMSAARSPYQSLTPIRCGVPANVLRTSSGPLISCLFSGQASVMAPRSQRSKSLFDHHWERILLQQPDAWGRAVPRRYKPGLGY